MPEMGLYEAMSTLRAVRRLRPDPIPDDVLRRVMQAATWAPSGGNRQPWRMIMVKDPAIKARLGEMYQQTWGKLVETGRAALEKMPEPDRTKLQRSRAAGSYLAAHLGQTPVIAVVCFLPELLAVTDAKLDRLSVVGGGSIYPAVQNLLLACRNEGLGCVLTTLLCGYEPEVRELLSIPQPWCTAAFVPIGYPVGSGHGPISRRPIEEMFYLDTWGKHI